MKNPKAMYALSYGLFVLTARQGEKDNGCIINTAAQVTTTPNRITITVNKSNYTHDMVLATGQFTLSILSEQADFALFQRFGFQSGRDTDKFEGFPHTARDGEGLCYLTKDANMTLSGRVEEKLDLGTHTLFVARVTEARVLSQAPSCTYAYYQSHIKPQPQEKKGWVCVVCGYVYEGDPLPEDFICPLCGHGAEDFVRRA